jgi:hypothetical protein
MKFTEYSPDADTATIVIPVRDLFTINSIMTGLLATFEFQDPTILSADQERVQELRNGTMALLSEIGAVRGRR